MQYLEGEIRQITEWVWSSMLERELLFDPSGTWPLQKANSLLSSVKITGDWEGAVALQCSPALAHQLAANMFKLPPQETSHADIYDALGELTNMIGGNIKALLPNPSRLSLPLVEDGESVPASLLTSTVLSQVAFADQGESFNVFLLVAEQAAAK
jgi:chemotaxis protein CheX